MQRPVICYDTYPRVLQEAGLDLRSVFAFPAVEQFEQTRACGLREACLHRFE